MEVGRDWLFERQNERAIAGMAPFYKGILFARLKLEQVRTYLGKMTINGYHCDSDELEDESLTTG